jgi:hypothetical protein
MFSSNESLRKVAHPPHHAKPIPLGKIAIADLGRRENAGQKPERKIKSKT